MTEGGEGGVVVLLSRFTSPFTAAVGQSGDIVAPPEPSKNVAENGF